MPINENEVTKEQIYKAMQWPRHTWMSFRM